MEYSQIILEYMKKCNVTPYKLAKDTGISESLFSKWKTKPTSDITYRVVTQIANYFCISTDYLLGLPEQNQNSNNMRENEKMGVNKDETKNKIREVFRNIIKQVPLYEWTKWRVNSASRNFDIDLGCVIDVRGIEKLNKAHEIIQLLSEITGVSISRLKNIEQNDVPLTYQEFRRFDKISNIEIPEYDELCEMLFNLEWFSEYDDINRFEKIDSDHVQIKFESKELAS